MEDTLSGAGGGHVEQEQGHGDVQQYDQIRAKQEMSNRPRVRYQREELLAVRQQAVPSSPAVWSDVLVDLGPVAQELSELDADKAAASITPPRKRNVDRRQRGAGRLPIEAPGVIWCGRKDAENQLVYEPVAPGSKLEDLAESDVECAGFAEVVDDDVYAESDSEEESFQPRAFAVQGEPDFESGPPQDGWEYLRRVRWEAALYPKVKVARIDPKKFASAQTPYLPDIPEVQRCAPELLPLPEWETQFLADFSDLRLRLAGVQVPPSVSPTTNLPSVRNKAAWQTLCFGTIPASTASDEESHLVDEELQLVEDEAESLGADGMDEATESIWSAQILHESKNEGEDVEMKNEIGEEDTQGMPLTIESALDPENLGLSTGLHGEFAETISAGEDAEKIGSNGPDLYLKQTSCASPADIAGLEHVNSHPDREAEDKTYDVSGPLSQEPRQLQLPGLAVVLKLDSVSRAALLRDQVSWLESVPGLPRDRALWLFSLAAVVDKPLGAETSAAVRALFRRCAEIRASKSNDDEELVMLNMLLTISGRYFGQAELAVSGKCLVDSNS